MKKMLLSILLLVGCVVLGLQAQNTAAQGFNYQAVARDAAGQILAHQAIALKISLSAKDGDQAKYYSEIHELKTDALGLFHLIIGRGKETVGQLSEVPFSKEQIWLNLELDPSGGRTFNLTSRSELMSVPYAFHAATASQLVENATEINLPTEKNQSIYWTTGGNTNTRPATHFLGTRDKQDLVFKTDNITRMVITADGRIQTFSVCAENGDQDPESYAIVAEGCKQGVYIKVNGTRSNDNNFLTFADDEAVWGRVEGQTYGELITSFEYIWQNAVFGIEITAYAADIVGLAAELATVTVQVLTAAEAVGVGAQLTAATIRGVQLIAELVAYNIETSLNVGVAYESGSGDYAEWLERGKDERDLLPGEVVGVKGGKISLNTQQADHFMVVSHSPIVLGNMPKKTQEALFEKVAFMGQVPVRVVGKVDIGDYLLPSGNHDGMAIAVKPAEMKAGDYSRIIGVAWQAGKDAAMNLINAAVGLNQNQLGNKVEALQNEVVEVNQKLDKIIAFLEGKGTLDNLADLNQAVQNAPSPALSKTTLQKALSEAEFDRLIDNNADLLNQYYAGVEAGVKAKGYDLTQYPQIQAFFQNPLENIKKMRRDPSLTSQWGYFDQKLKARK